jgi:cytochrome P450
VSGLASLEDPALLDDPYCLGHALARLEARMALGSLIARMPRLAPAPDDTPRRASNFSLRRFTSLPVTYGEQS